jgi:hypothetical protein
VPKKSGGAFPFFQFLFESGCWREASPSAKALYPIMRFFGHYDRDECITEDEYPEDGFIEEYKERHCDICEAELRVMADLAGITRQSVYAALKDLSRCLLIERMEDEPYRWRVFVRSKDNRYFLRSYLNEQVMKSYAYAL